MDPQPKTLTRVQLREAIHAVIRDRKLSQNNASKLRGKANWTGSHTFGRCGRIGFGVLRDKQSSDSAELDEHDVARLRFLARVVEELPPRQVQVAGRRPPSVILYTDILR